MIGSVPRRLLLAIVSKAPFPPHLIDLDPFTSDIDVVHEGQPSQTPAIARDIAYVLPFAELFRWQVASRQERRQYDTFLAESAHVVPDNLLTLDDRGLHDPYNAGEDYARSQLRFELNKGYAQSELFRQRRDLPIFAALLWLRNALQAAPYLDGFDILAQPAIENVAEAVRATRISPTFQSSLAGSGYLKSRSSISLRRCRPPHVPRRSTRHC